MYTGVHDTSGTVPVSSFLPLQLLLVELGTAASSCYLSTGGAWKPGQPIRDIVSDMDREAWTPGTTGSSCRRTGHSTTTLESNRQVSMVQTR